MVHIKWMSLSYTRAKRVRRRRGDMGILFH